MTKSAALFITRHTSYKNVLEIRGLHDMHIVLAGTSAGFIAGAAAIARAAAVFFVKKTHDKFLDASEIFAAGAMLFVTVEELMPGTHSRGNARETTAGIIPGFVAMMLLENIFA